MSGIEEASGRRGTRWRLASSLVALALFWPVTLTPAAESTPAPPAAPAISPAAAAAPPQTQPSRAAMIEKERRKTASDLDVLAGKISLSQESLASLDQEIGRIADDRTKIRSAMIEAAAAQKAISADIDASEKRIGALATDEASLKASLHARRGLLAEVLAALERMGRKPPPALLVKPEDALGSVRSAILLGAVVPSIRKETETLVADLQQLSDVKRKIGEEKAKFVAGLTKQKEEEARLARLFDEKQKLEADSRERREAESRRVAELASKATSLKDLIASLDADLQSARAAEAAARQLAEAKKAEEARRAAEAKTPPPAAPAEKTPSSYDVASLRRDMKRIEPAAPFSTMKGRLSVPVAGDLRIGFGETDDIGRTAEGQTFTARAGDLVTAPADAWVLYAGPFRSYGQLLILNAGDGYHIVLAGMSENDVNVGQFVASGEPVARMGARRVASAVATDFNAAAPSLYVEFRKDGKPVDPAEWWMDRPSGRTRNDS